MFRSPTRSLVLVAVAVVGGPAFGQRSAHPSGAAPHPTGVVAGVGGRPFGPGIGSYNRFGGVPWFGGFAYAPFGLGSYYPPYQAYYPYGVGYGAGWVGPVQAPPVEGAGVGGLPVAPVLELPAEWTIEFPTAAADVRVNGEPASGTGPVRKLTSPPLKAGATYSFAVTAKWTDGGTRYTWDRTVALGPGERSRTVVSRGFVADQ